MIPNVSSLKARIFIFPTGAQYAAGNLPVVLKFYSNCLKGDICNSHCIKNRLYDSVTM